MSEVTLIQSPPDLDDPFASAEARRQTKRRRQRLTQAEKNPRLALERGWHQDPAFCAGLLDRCEHQAFVCAPGALAMAQRLVEIAEKSGDPHLANRSVGVLSYAYLARWDHHWAGKILDLHRPQILDCCHLCRSEYFRRQGDLLAEQRQVAAALEAFGHAFTEHRGVFEADDYGRFCFNRSLGYHFQGDRDRALADLGRTLRHTSLKGPRGYFADTPAMAAVYILGGDPCHDRQALAMVEGLGERIRGRRGWGAVRTRMVWVKGILHARLGHVRRARRYLRTAHSRILHDGLPREAVAVSLDLAQLGCRHWELTDRSVKTAREVLGRCLKRPDLRPDHRLELKKLRDEVLVKYPYDAFRLLGELRCSFIAVVPNRLDERIEQA